MKWYLILIGCFFAINASARGTEATKKIRINCLNQYKTLAQTAVTPTTKDQVRVACSGKEEFARCVSYGIVGAGIAPVPASGDNCALPKLYMRGELACETRPGVILNNFNLNSSIVTAASLLFCGKTEKRKATILGPNGLPINL